ncbi:hypothetical protein EVAR_11363_1 [Eumeta japonica]|uniref:Uncharacterized protein n=1 Tax=Eumeta variegata TaxID=151549 RepID=A0A4C1U0T5_EUMVA|nr:hypothetical protein EVAR_11363_1 [Eumeta japonica]
MTGQSCPIYYIPKISYCSRSERMEERGTHPSVRTSLPSRRPPGSREQLRVYAHIIILCYAVCFTQDIVYINFGRHAVVRRPSSALLHSGRRKKTPPPWPRRLSPTCPLPPPGGDDSKAGAALNRLCRLSLARSSTSSTSIELEDSDAPRVPSVLVVTATAKNPKFLSPSSPARMHELHATCDHFVCTPGCLVI